MRAILLAAGRGRRLGLDGPKCLLDIGGQTLLRRHVHHLARAGVDALTVVTGHGAAMLADELGTIDSGIPIETVHNPRFVHGAIVSLQCVADRLLEGAIWMDADVLYPTALLADLVHSEHPNCVLIDGRANAQGEEMMLAVRQDRVRRIARGVGSGWDLVGESVGFFKVDAEGGAAMKRVLDAEVAAGRLDQEHEDALDKVLPEVAFGYERVDAYDWTEIDFPEDVERAEQIATCLGS